MPLLSGTDVAAIIRQREFERHDDRPPVKIVLLSAHLVPVTSDDIKRLNIVGVWQKPIELPILIKNIDEVLSEKH